jgi:hypothetical protein
MAVTQTQIDALERAITSGVLTVEYDGRKTVYQSTEALLKALAYAKGELAQSQGLRTTQSFAQFTRD